MKILKKSLLPTAILIFVLQSCIQPTIQSGYDVFKLMHDKHNKSWYHNMTFTQETQWITDNTITKTEIWEEAYSSIGNLNVKFNGFDSGEGLLFTDGFMYVFHNHNLEKKVPKFHELITLGFDIYHQDIKTTTIQLLSLEYNLDYVTDTIWNDKKVYIIGKKSLTKDYKQIIIDKKKLVFLASINKSKGITEKVHFLNYDNIDGNIVATQVDFLKNGEVHLREIYSNIKFPKEIDQSVFDFKKFSSSKW